MTSISSIQHRAPGTPGSEIEASLASITSHAPYIDAMTLAQWRVLAGKRKPKELPTGLDAFWHAAEARVVQLAPRRRALMHAAMMISTRQRQLEELDEDALHELITEVRTDARLGRLSRERQYGALAILAETARRTLGLRAYPVQLAGALTLVRGQLAEMATGEGKTLTAALAAALIGWRGRGCHVVTVNDYLARRDAEWGQPFFEACGLRVAAIDQEMEAEQRARAYAASITYATQKELAADYLRDRLSGRNERGLADMLIDRLAGARPTGGTVMRGLYYAIVDEADSVLIDEAATPLILSAESGDAARIDAIHEAAALAQRLSPDKHYRVNRRYREIHLTAAGKRLIEQQQPNGSPLWRVKRFRDELIHQAISARELYLKDDAYVIDEGKIVIVDPSTGRLMPDRTWREGYHQAVEAKEGLEITPIKETLARISFQRFFRGYQGLSGMTGTAYEARHELWRVYRLPVVRIPRNRPLQRTMQPEEVADTTDAKWAMVLQAVLDSHAKGQPVLVGTTSVDDSERLSRLLTAEGVEHQVLNAVNHRQEAAIVAKAGRLGAVTVATNMAGRGTDIKLPPEVIELGGLHVIAAVRNAAARIDRQLFGRCARQGDPGVVSRFTSLEDELPRRYLPAHERRLAARAPVDVRRWMLRSAQWRAERMSSGQRIAVMRSDDWLDQHLGFAPDVI